MTRLNLSNTNTIKLLVEILFVTFISSYNILKYEQLCLNIIAVNISYVMLCNLLIAIIKVLYITIVINSKHKNTS